MIIPYYCEDYPEDPPEPCYRPIKKDDKNAKEREKQQPVESTEAMKNNSVNRIIQPRLLISASLLKSFFFSKHCKRTNTNIYVLSVMNNGKLASVNLLRLFHQSKIDVAITPPTGNFKFVEFLESTLYYPYASFVARSFVRFFSI